MEKRRPIPTPDLLEADVVHLTKDELDHAKAYAFVMEEHGRTDLERSEGTRIIKLIDAELKRRGK